MVKKVLVRYDELGKPIELVELKEFHDPSVLKQFKEQCDSNKREYLGRLQEKAQNEQLEKQELENRLNALQNEIASLKSVISHVLGYVELTDDQLAEILNIEIEEPEESVEEQPEGVE